MSPRRTADAAAATRDALIDAALEVFAERGFARAQLEEIAGRAELTRGALYHHFSNKADLFTAVLAERWPKAVAPLRRLLDGGGPSRPRVRAFVAAFCSALERDSTVRALLKMSMSDPTRPAERMRAKADAMREWIDAVARAVSSDHDLAAARRIGLAVVIFLNGVTLTAMLGPEIFSPASEAESLADACVGGVFP